MKFLYYGSQFVQFWVIFTLILGGAGVVFMMLLAFAFWSAPVSLPILGLIRFIVIMALIFTTMFWFDRGFVDSRAKWNDKNG